MKNALLLLILIGGISCGPTLKVTSDYDRSANFSGYKTFAVYNLKTTGSVSQLNADRIVKAIEAEMTAKGFKEVSNNDADLIINAVTILKDQKDVSTTTNYYGFGGVYRPYGYWGGGNMAYGTTSTNVYEYKNGTLTIDIVDNKSQKMVWQGIGNADIDGAPKDPDMAIKTAVTKIMDAFPPGVAQ